MAKKTVFQGQRGLIVSIFVASLFLNVLVLTAPLYMLQLFSRVMSSGSMSTLAVLTIGAIIALLFGMAFDVIRQRLASRLGTRLEAMHGPTVLSILVQSASATDRRGAQPMRDLQELRRFVTSPAFTAMMDAPWAIIFLGIIFLFHPLLGFVALTAVVVLAGLGVMSELSSRRSLENATASGQSANALAEEMVRNADVLRAMSHTPGMIDRWRGAANDSMADGTKVVDSIGTWSSAARMVRMALQIAMLGVGVTLVLAGSITPGIMIAGSILATRAASPVEQSISGWRSMMQARMARRRLNVMLEAVEEAAHKVELPEPDGRLSLEHATIVVPERQNPLIFDVSFDLRPGQSLGVIGPSGSGKTTLARALAGLHPLSRGHIRIDDASLDDWPPEQIGRHIGFLPQRIELFDGTIAENIAAMDPTAPSAAIVAAAKKAEVHDLILSLPGGYNAQVGVRGELLSAGQRQRIALARAFYGDRKIIVLDEPNANLDPHGEQALATAVRNATDEGAVVIVVTHRPAILKMLTHSALMRDGRLERFGETGEIMAEAARRMPDYGMGGNVTQIDGKIRAKAAESQEARA